MARLRLLAFHPHHPGGGRKLRDMPYRVNSELPPAVRGRLPEHAQDIYREAFNHAFAAHAGEFDRERRAHMIAWAVVKRGYVKDGDMWVSRHSGAEESRWQHD
jgi:cation transport regulator